ncbi:hypothetical protein GBAR_LOCUS9260, partial [Geodia barretti]
FSRIAAESATPSPSSSSSAVPPTSQSPLSLSSTTATTTTNTSGNQGRSTQEAVTGQGGDVRKRRNVKEQESQPNRNDDDRITSSETTSHSQSALGQGCLGKLVITILISVAVGLLYFFLS